MAWVQCPCQRNPLAIFGQEFSLMSSILRKHQKTIRMGQYGEIPN